MNVRERYLATYHHQPVDRVPIALSYFHAGFARKHFPRRAQGVDPIEDSIQRQLHYGFDPHCTVAGTADWQLAYPYPGQEPPGYEEATRDWHVTHQTRTLAGSTLLRTDYRIETPSGVLTCVRTQTPDDFGTIDEPFIKEEEDIALLRHRPDPRYIVNPALIRHSMQTMGDRCWGMASVVGVWGLASFLRGPERIMMDCYDRPEWVKRFLGILGEYQAELVKAIGRDAGTPAPVLRLDGSFIGFGLSRGLFREFIYEPDKRIVDATHSVGMMLHLHICGKKNAFLEDLVDMGIDALETLTPAVAAGDVDLADVKRRIGDRVCLMGGFLSHTLAFGTPADVEVGVKECLAKAAQGGGYILSPTGRIDPETPEENLLAFTEAGRKYGRQDGA